jgi:hypothetical protein
LFLSHVSCLQTKILLYPSLLSSYWDNVTVGPLTYTAFHRGLELSHKRSKSLKHLPSRQAVMKTFSLSKENSSFPFFIRQVVRKALKCFLRAMDIDYEEAFQCPCCSELPDNEKVFICDGHTMGFRKDGALPPSTPISQALGLDGNPASRVIDYKLKETYFIKNSGWLEKFKDMIHEVKRKDSALCTS